MLPHYRTLLIATFNFSNNNSKTTNNIILHEKHRIIKNRKASHTLNKYFTDLFKTLKLKKDISCYQKVTSGRSAEALISPVYEKNAKTF